jgi:hypothetical protein
VPGALDVSKVVDVSGIINASSIVDSFTIEVIGPSYPGGITQVFDFDGASVSPDPWSLTNLIPGLYTVTETVQGVSYTWNVSGEGDVSVTAGSTASKTITNTFVPGSLEITKVVELGDVINPSGIDETFTVTVTGPSYPNGHVITFTLVDGVITSTNPVVLLNLIPGSYTIVETDAGAEWTEVVTSSPTAVSAGAQAQATVTNTYIWWSFTPGFWKNHTSESPSGHDAWQYTDYATDDLLNVIFDTGGGFEGETLLDALSYQGGKGLMGAKRILLRAAVAALLNASFHETMGHEDYLYYPYLSGEIIDVVNVALGGSRSDILELAAHLDEINNGNHFFDWSWPIP